jgi:Domain of unknown function (DUF4394)/PEP-CTERM motif
MHRIRHLVAALVGALALGPAVAEPVYGVSMEGTLFSFDSVTPATFTFIGPGISGLVSGHSLRAIDFRPSNGQLYAISTDGATAAQLYTVNLVTNALTAVGGGFTLSGNTATGSSVVSIDFNPVADALRVVTGAGQNYRVNANTGALIAQDTSISPSLLGYIADVAYSNNVAGASTTTLYAYNYSFNALGTIGGLNGVPSPNTGVFNAVGLSGIAADSPVIGFDISGLTGTAYLTIDDPSTSLSNSAFFRVDLATGATTRVANFLFPVLDIAVGPVASVVPEPQTLILVALGLATLAARRRRTTR